MPKVSIATFTTGMVLGWPSVAIPLITDGSAGFTLTDYELSVMVAIPSFSALISPIPCGYLSDYIGRKNTLFIAAIVVIIAWVMLAFSTNVWLIYTARFLCGLWGGVEYSLVVLYICEVAEPKYRGGLGALSEMLLFCGALFESAIGRMSYKSIAILSAVPPLVLAIGLLLIPESPYFYLMKEDRETAKKNMKWLRGTCEDKDILPMEVAVKEQLNNTGSFSEIFTSPGNLKSFLTIEALKIVIGSSSVILLMAYGTIILPDTYVNSTISYIILCFVWVISALIACLIMDKINRRTFLYLSSVVAIITNSCAAAWFYLRDKTTVDTSSTTWVPLIALMFAGLVEAGGIFNVPNVVKGEIFPINIKSKACALCCMTAFFFEGITTFFFYSITNNVGLYFNFVKIVITSLMCICIVKFALIETRGKTLEEIQSIINEQK